MSSVVEQLEQDRIVASKRAKRLQEDLKKTQQVHTSRTRIHLPQDRPSARQLPVLVLFDLPTVVCFSLLCLCFHFLMYCPLCCVQDHAAALKQVSDLKAKLAEVRKSTRKDVTALQAKLTKVTRSLVPECLGTRLGNSAYLLRLHRF